MNSEPVLRLIVIDDSSNDAETVSNMLRNAGHAVRAARVQDDEDLRDALSTQTCDLVLCKSTIPYFTPLEALSVIGQQQEDIPLIVLDDGNNEERTLEILDAGACDAISPTQPRRLLHAILREADGVFSRRQHRICEERLLESNQRAQALVDSSRDSIAYVHEGMHVYANHSYLQMFGYSDLGEIEGMPIMSMISKEEHDKFKSYLRDHVKGEGNDELEVQALKADSTHIKITMEFAPASYEGEPCTQIIIRDQSLSKELEEKLDSLSKQDLLTGLYNRQYFLDSLKANVGRKGSEGAVLFIKVDDFKKVREEVGLGACDTMLTEVAGLLSAQLNDAKDVLSRFESNLFSAILFGAEDRDAGKIAEAMLHAVSEHVFAVSGRQVAVTVSIGSALFNEAIRDPLEIVSRADRACTEASQKGNRFLLYNPAAEEMAEQERNSIWSKKIKLALRDNNFRLLFQPIVSLVGGAKENYEVLLRLLDENGEEVPPTDFLPPAEKAGLMVALDRWVLAHAIKLLAERQRTGKPNNFFIKISSDSLKDPKLLPWLRDVLKAVRLAPNTLILELSETVAANNLRLVKMLAAGLQQLRVGLAIDHFAQAPNYENLLKNSDANIFKISGKLIGNLAKDPEVQAKVREITSAAKELGKKTVAECVEDAGTLAAIWSSGVDYIQGHFLQAPAPELNYDFSSMA